jgi:hypothetical protein
MLSNDSVLTIYHLLQTEIQRVEENDITVEYLVNLQNALFDVEDLMAARLMEDEPMED